MTRSEAWFAPVQLIEQHLETRTPKKENASNLAVVPRPNRYEGATQTKQTLILLGSLACLTITSPHLFRNGDWRLEEEEWRCIEHSALLSRGIRGYTKAMADKSCTLRCATNKVHMRAPAREPPPSCLAEPTDLVQLPATSASSSMHTPLKLVLHLPKQSASFYRYRTLILDLQKARLEGISDGPTHPR